VLFEVNLVNTLSFKFTSVVFTAILFTTSCKNHNEWRILTAKRCAI